MSNLQSEVERERIVRAYGLAGIDFNATAERIAGTLWNVDKVKVHEATATYFHGEALREAEEFLTNPVTLNLLHDVFDAGARPQLPLGSFDNPFPRSS